MNTNPKIKTERKNYRFSEEIACILKSRTIKSGKTATQEIEDLLRGVRIFSREAEAFLDSETERSGKERWLVIEDAVLLMARIRNSNGHAKRETVGTEVQGGLKAGKTTPARRKQALDALQRSKAKN